ncbi:MAG: hypothetical protein WCT26_03125 [Candidatus Buchananbacteria bacterium]|jgi:hypothetical protein
MSEKKSKSLSEVFAAATPEEIEEFSKQLNLGRPLSNAAVQQAFLMLQSDVPPYGWIIKNLSEMGRYKVDEVANNFRQVTAHILVRGGKLVEEWMKSLLYSCKHYHFSDQLMLGLPLGLLELVQKSDYDLPKEYFDGLDSILVELINYADKGILDQYFDDNYRGRLSNAVKGYFNIGNDRSSNMAHVRRVLARIKDLDDSKSVSFNDGFICLPIMKTRLNLTLLNHINYAFFKMLDPKEAVDLICEMRIKK